MSWWTTLIEHSALGGGLLYIILALKRHGIGFDIHIWRNGNGKDKSTEAPSPQRKDSG